LLRMITGIFYPDSGEISFDGQQFNAERDIVKIGYMPEERGLYKKMKIGEQVLYLAQLKGLSKQEATQKVKYWFEKLDMQSWWNKKVEDLSKGMSQKLQFVTTVLHEPKLIILDEPFSGLDPVNANLIKDEIYGLAKRGSTVIFSTHRMEQVEEICDHIVLVNMGKKILDGTVQSVKQQFKQSLYKISFEQPVLPEHVATFLFEVKEKGNDWLVIRRSPEYNNNQVLQYFADKGLTIASFNEILPSLNDIFIHLVDGTKAVTRTFQEVAS
jgi:ABC-2 type transport system ATP-binding protein